jgi:hypothetical protein
MDGDPVGAHGKNYTHGMPISYEVFLPRNRAPSGAEWLQALRDNGFAVEFAADTDLSTHSGYLPCPDERAGFELYCEKSAAAREEISSAGVAVVGDRDLAVTFRFSGRTADREAAVAAAATLTAMSDGVLFDAESGHFIASGAALAWARNEDYRPIAVYRARASRRRSRIRASTVIRVLMLLLVTVVFALLFG